MEPFREEISGMEAIVADIDMGLWKLKDDLSNALNDLKAERKNSILNKYDDIIKAWQDTVTDHRFSLNKIRQARLANFIEVSGIPEDFAKDLEGLAGVLSIVLRMRVDSDFIVGFERQGDINEDQVQPRPLIVKLFNQNLKNRILHVASFGGLYMYGNNSPVVITEYLTLMSKQLLRKVRQEAFRHGIKKVWTSNGQIFVQRNETSPVYEIQREKDVFNMGNF